MSDVQTPDVHQCDNQGMTRREFIGGAALVGAGLVAASCEGPAGTAEASTLPPREVIVREMVRQATEHWAWAELGPVFAVYSGNAGVAEFSAGQLHASITCRPTGTQMYLIRYYQTSCLWETISGPGSPDAPNQYGYFNDTVTLSDGTTILAYTEGDPSEYNHELKIAVVGPDGTLGAITDPEVAVRRNTFVSAFPITLPGDEAGFAVITQHYDTDAPYNIDIQMTRHYANGQRYGEKITVSTGDDNEWPAESGPAITPDGIYVAFTNQRPEDVHHTVTDIYIQKINLDGTLAYSQQITTAAGEQSHPQIAYLNGQIHVAYEHKAGDAPEDRDIRCATVEDNGSAMSVVRDERIAFGGTNEELGGDQSLAMANMKYKRLKTDGTIEDVIVPVMMIAGSVLRDATDPDTADIGMYFVNPDTLQPLEIEVNEGTVETLDPLFMRSTNGKGLYAPSIRFVPGTTTFMLLAHEYNGVGPEGHNLNQVVAFRGFNKISAIYLPLTVKGYGG